MFASYKELHQLVEEEIARLDYKRQPEELYQPIGYMLSLGGKRLRPILVLMGANLYTSHYQKALKAALSIEMFHNFTLVHDDIMDNADIRRGKPTVHTKWNNTIAILSGDLMMIKATDLLCETETDNISSLIKLFNQTAAQVCEGQQWDMNYETQTEVSQIEYLNMITLKTAVLIGLSLQIGSLIGGADKTDAMHLYEFGKNMGVCFQIQDDILDSFGVGSQVGKKIGGDIVANKKTILLIEAINAATNQIKTELTQLINANQFNEEEKIKAVLNIYKQTKVLEKAEQLKSQYLQKAFSHLDKLSIDTDHLKQLAVNIMERMS